MLRQVRSHGRGWFGQVLRRSTSVNSTLTRAAGLHGTRAGDGRATGHQLVAVPLLGPAPDAGRVMTTPHDPDALRGSALPPRRYFQDLWMGSFQATSVAVDSGSVGVMSMGRSSSFPL